ncbi:hypothetical protein N8911_00400 [bacterium]|nr:hypothetical protein [bacterium]
MKRLLNYILILSLSLFVFGCRELTRELTDAFSSLMNDSSESDSSETNSEVISGPTIDTRSDEFQYIEKSKKGITNYKGVPFNGILTIHYNNGVLGKITPYKNGKEDGTYEEYYLQGQLRRKIPYKNGKENGVFEMYYKNGQLKQKATYYNGVLSSVFEEYNYDGTRSN